MLLGIAICARPAAAAPISLGSDLSTIDICKLISAAEIETVLGRKLVIPPKRFEYYDTQGTSGCWYDAGKNAQKEAFFGYAVLTPAQVYAEQPLYLQKSVPGIGKSAYFNNGADARQLWVKINDRVALVVAFGDEPKEEGAKKIAKLLLDRVR